MTDDLRASSACPVCGKDTPHAHHNTEAELALVARPTFEDFLCRWLQAYLPAKRVHRGTDLGVQSWHRDYRPKRQSGTHGYVDPVIDGLWILWLGAWMGKPSWCNAFDSIAMQEQIRRQSPVLSETDIAALCGGKVR